MILIKQKNCVGGVKVAGTVHCSSKEPHTCNGLLTDGDWMFCLLYFICSEETVMNYVYVSKNDHLLLEFDRRSLIKIV